MTVRYPNMRAQIVEAVQALADRQYQQRVWVGRVYPHPDFYDDLTHTISVLYDDTEVAADPDSQIGVTLENKEEAATIAAIIGPLDAVLDAANPQATDAEIVALPGWESVVRAAQSALPVFSR